MARDFAQLEIIVLLFGEHAHQEIGECRGHSVKGRTEIHRT
jgi:hypothetical protein